MSELRIYRRSELEAISPTPDSEGCLHRYKAIWIDGVDDTSDVALVGIAFAAVKHAYIVMLRDNGISQDAGLAEAAFAEGVAKTKTPSRLIPDVLQLWMFHAESFELDLDRFVAAEERGSAGDVGFTPDLVYAHPDENTLEVIDDKSGWHPPITEAQLKTLFQARVYSRYARDRWPNFSRYKFTLHAVRFKRSVTVEFTNEELDRVELEVRGAIATIEEALRTNVWPATPGPSCHFCELDCPVAHQEQALPKRILNPEFAQNLAGWVNVASKQVAMGKKLLKGYVVAHGPLQANGLEWANRPSESKSYPIDVVLDALTMAGGMGAFTEEGLTISHSALAKIFKRFPMLEEALAASAKRKTTYRFGAKNPELPPARPDMGDAEGDDDE